MADDISSFLNSGRTPVGQTSPNVSGQNLSDFLNEGKPGTPAVPTAESPAAVAPSPALVGQNPSWLGYLGGKFLSGMIQGGEGMTRGELGPYAALAPQNVPIQEGLSNEQRNQLVWGGKEPPPANLALRYGGALAEGLTGALPFTIAAPGSTIVGTLTGELAHQLFPTSQWAPAIGGAIGGGAYQIGSGITRAFINRRSIEQTLQDAQAAFTKKANELTEIETKALPVRENLAKSTLALDEAKRLARETTDSALEVANQQVLNLANQLGTSKTFQAAGEQLQAGARTWLEQTMPQAMATAYAPLDALIPPTTPGAVFNFAHALKTIDVQAGGLEDLAKVLKPQLPNRLRSVFDDVMENPAITKGTPDRTVTSSILDPVTGKPLATVVPGESGIPVTYADMQQFRSILGDAKTRNQIVQNIGQKNLDHLYSALTSDMEAVAREIGPDALTAFSNANTQAKALYQIAEGPMARIVKSGTETAADPSPETIAKRLLGGGRIGASDLATLRTLLPTELDQLASAYFHTGLESGKAGPVLWGALAPEARAALVPNQAHQKLLSGTQELVANSIAEAGTRMASVTGPRRTLQEQMAQANAELGQGRLAREIASNELTSAKFAKQDIVSANQLALTETLKSLGVFGAGGALGIAGNTLAPMIDKQTGMTNDSVWGLAAIGALGLRQAARLAGGAAVNPKKILGPLAGGMAGNQLTP